MKIKHNVYITNLDQYLRGEYTYCFGIWAFESVSENDIFLCSVDIDIPEMAQTDLQGIAVGKIDEQINVVRAAATAKITELEAQRNELLAITHQPDLEVV